jgi:hypothetical protein
MLDKDLRFKGKSGVTLGEEIYLYKDFYDDVNGIERDLLDMSEDDWKTHGNYEAEDHSRGTLNDRLSLDFVTREFHDRIINFVSPQYWILSNGNFMRTRPEDEPVKQDLAQYLKNVDYALAYYAGDFDGGEVVFTDTGVTYAPQKNDLLIFKPTTVELLKVNSGVKYSYIDFLVVPPGYFMA